MTDKKPFIKGLNCPNCGGVLQIIEGETLVECPYCGLRSILTGDRGVHRLQVRERINQQIARDIAINFLSGKAKIAADLSTKSQITESLLIYTPFWVCWRRVIAWVLGQDRVKSGKSSYYVPKEISIVKDMAWNGAACDISELGIQHIPLVDENYELFSQETLDRRGLIFQPASTISYARMQAERAFEDKLAELSGLERIQQIIHRGAREKIGLVYFPLWVIRYAYKNRTYQVVVDGSDGGVLFANAPGNLLFRAAMLVLSILLGVLLTITVPVISFTGFLMIPGVTSFFPCPIFSFIIGLVIIGAGYKVFSGGEEYTYHWLPKNKKKIKIRTFS
jgi:DNA-directed RNA polymerase subunit RPC12/RpoP